MQSVVRSSLVGLLALASLTACGDKVDIVQPTSTPGGVHGVTVTPSSVPSLAVGASVTLSASVDADASVTDRTVTWSTSDATVASVDQTGKVLGVKAGTVTITAAAKAAPDVKGAALVTVGGGGAVPTVTISTINQTVCGVVVVGQPPICSSIPANLTNVAGQVDVTLNVDANGQALKSITALLKCGNDSVAQTSTFSSNVAQLDANEASAPVTLSFNTAAFSPAGVVALHNGQCSISASAVTASGTQSATTTQLFTLNNPDVAVVTVSSTSSATDPINRPWIGGGPLTISALPIMYSGRTAVAATIGIAGGVQTPNSTAPNPPSQTITAPTAGAFTATWTNGPTAPSVQNYAATGVTPTVSLTDASGAAFTTIGSVTVKGGTTTNTPASQTFNFDDQKPLPGTFSVTNNPDQSIIAGTGYIGAAFRFAADSAAGYRGPSAGQPNTLLGGGAVYGATGNSDNNGVDKVTVVFQARQGTGTFAAVTGTSTLAESATSGTYNFRMITMDALGNADTSATTTFGVDKTAPTNVAAAAPASGSTTTTASGLGDFTFAISDNLSGTGVALVAQVRQWNGLTSVSSLNEGRINTNVVAAGFTAVGSTNAGSTTQDPCYIGRFNATQAAAGPNALPVFSATGAALGFCTPVVYTLANGNTTVPTSFGVDGYWTTSVIATDIAGNQGTPVTRTILEDVVPPTVNNIDLPPTAVGNSTVSFPASVTDNASSGVGDIIGSWITQTFAGPAVSLRWPTTSGPGVAFDNVLTNSTTVTPAIPNFIKNLQVGAVTAVPAAGGNVSSVTVTALGAAQNSGSLTANLTPGLPQLVGGSTSTFTATTIPNWAIQAPANANVSNCPNDACLSGTTSVPATQPTSITLTVTATGPTGTFVNPFATGTVEFWYRPTGNAVWYLIGNAAAGSSRDTGVGGNRFWDFSITFNPPNFTPDQVALTTAGMTIEVAAIGINANGDAIMTAPVTLTIANP